MMVYLGLLILELKHQMEKRPFTGIMLQNFLIETGQVVVNVTVVSVMKSD